MPISYGTGHHEEHRAEELTLCLSARCLGVMERQGKKQGGESLHCKIHTLAKVQVEAIFGATHVHVGSNSVACLLRSLEA